MNKNQLGYIEGLISVLINTVLFLLKLWVGIITGSVAMIADAWHTISDSLTSLLVITGLIVSGKPADKQHPFGHGRAELIASIVIGTLLLVVGFNFIVESIRRLIQFQKTEYKQIAIYVFLISAIIKEALAQFSFWAGRKTDYSSLIADGWHHRSDAIASILIVIGGVASYSFWWIDGVLGIIVSLLIIFTSCQIVFENGNILLGEKIEEDLEPKIRKAISEIAPEVKDVHHFHIHKYGDHTELTLHICLSPKMKLETAHKITDLIEEKIRSDFKIEATVHIEHQKDENDIS
ncbi:MAG: cation diffusion facilitator family transporter [Endomicrobiia bacterium]